MNNQDAQMKLANLRKEWFRGLITTDEMVCKALDVAVQNMEHAKRMPTPTLLENESRQVGLDIAWHFGQVFPLVRK